MSNDRNCSCGPWKDKILKFDRLPHGITLENMFVLDPSNFSNDAPYGSSLLPLIDRSQWIRITGQDIFWNSEAHLCKILASEKGWSETKNIIQNYRSTFYDMKNFEQIKKNGITYVTVQIPWQMFFEKNDETTATSTTTTPTRTTPDGFVRDIFSREPDSFIPSVTFEEINSFLTMLSRLNLRIILELTTLPGQIGPAFVFTPWPNALLRMDEERFESWVAYCVRLEKSFVDFVLNKIPLLVRNSIHGLKPFKNSDKIVFFSNNLSPIIANVSKLLTTTIFQECILRKTEFFDKRKYSLYVNLSKTLGHSRNILFLRELAHAMRMQNIDSSKYLVHDTDMFFADWNIIPTSSEIRKWIRNTFQGDNIMPWRNSCCWNLSLPNNRILTSYIFNEDTKEIHEWKIKIFRFICSELDNLKIENTFVSWDSPYVCPNNEPEYNRHRQDMSLKCILVDD